ncbi:hypothetical protein E2C01_038574 [Portunus trituberculatus]|uniref:Uncharacterized protein n=1 Tax=Portunus trituberculatus TaxID=210409 RepID=A0A5B7FID0_PORTR|nr:hypothetical protein [Portunus trituberculatus]
MHLFREANPVLRRPCYVTVIGSTLLTRPAEVVVMLPIDDNDDVVRRWNRPPAVVAACNTIKSLKDKLDDPPSRQTPAKEKSVFVK